MIHFLNITGALLYIAFRIIVFPIVVLVDCLFAVSALITHVGKYGKQIRAVKIKPFFPLFRFTRLRFHFSKS